MDLDVITQTPEKTVKKKRRIFRPELEVSHTAEQFPLFSRNSTTFFNRSNNTEGNIKNEAYLFVDVSEVLNFSANCFPIQNRLHIIGKYTLEHDHYCVCLKHDHLKIRLDFALCSNTLVDNSEVSFYGAIDFRNGPIFVVKFYKIHNSNNALKYINLLKLQRNLLPSAFYEPITVQEDTLEDSTDNSCLLLENSSDSIFTNNITILDNLCANK